MRQAGVLEIAEQYTLRYFRKKSGIAMMCFTKEEKKDYGGEEAVRGVQRWAGGSERHVPIP